MNSTDPPDPAMLEKLNKQIEGFMGWSWGEHRRNNRFATVVVVLGIVLGIAVTAAGFLGYGVAAGLIGLAVTLFIGLQNAFNFSEKADFYRIVHVEAKVLRDQTVYKVRSQGDLERLVDTLTTLRRYAAQRIPKGRGIEVVKEIYSSLPLGTHSPG